MTTNLKRAIGHLNDVTELRELRKAIVERIDVLEKRAYAKRVDEAWERVKDLPLGTTLHVCASGTFFGGPYQRGDSFKLTYIKPRKRVIWVEAGGKQFGAWFGAQGVERYDLRTTPPANPMSKDHRESVERVATRVAESLAA